MTTDMFAERIAARYWRIFAPEDVGNAIMTTPGVWRVSYRTEPGCFFIDIEDNCNEAEVTQRVMDRVKAEFGNDPLKPCPFCASRNVKMHSYIDDVVHKLSCQIVCKNCGAVGPNELHSERAKVMWNLRRL